MASSGVGLILKILSFLRTEMISIFSDSGFKFNFKFLMTGVAYSLITTLDLGYSATLPPPPLALR
jgi:hypothetical protein